MLTKKQVRSSSNEKLREYIKTIVKPNIRMWQDE